MIYGIGTDIIEIDRLEKVINRYGQQFIDKIFTKKEQQYCLRYAKTAERFAGRFAAKEAVAKALGCGFGKHARFLDIEIINNKEGKPQVLLAQHLIEHYDNPTIVISISHCRAYATSTAFYTVQQEL